MGNSLRFGVTRRLHVPSHEVWRVLADFGTEHRWTKSLSHCERDTAEVSVGTARLCTLPKLLMGRTEARETLTEFEPGRVLAYVLDGSAGPFASASSRWSTSPASASTTNVTVEGWFEPKSRLVGVLLWPLVKPMLRRIARRGLGELETYVAATASPGTS